ncbi:MAG: phosphotransferase [Lachnospiraceae bacterium]|nr:phosphotransferase [Lachnospiraceae bacterium]
MGKLLEEPVKVDGGLLHKMYRVSTSKDVFAVKVLNPEIMKRAEALSNMVNSEKAARAFAPLIPVISSLEIGGKQVQKWGEYYYLVFLWIDGTPIFPREITPHHCEVIGDILGKMHQRELLIEGIIPEEDSFEMYDWETYLQRINELGSSWLCKSISGISGSDK